MRILFTILAAATLGWAGVSAEDLAAGGFDRVSQRTQGSWRLVEDDGQRFIVLSDDFRTRGAPDLKFFLHASAVDAIDGDNAAAGLFLAELGDHRRGALRLPISADFDLNDYQSFVLHCEAFSKLWAVGALDRD